MSDSTLQARPETRHVPDRLNSRAFRTLRSWESLLLAVAIAIFIVNSFASPYSERRNRATDSQP